MDTKDIKSIPIFKDRQQDPSLKPRNKTYWFRKKTDGSIFCVDGEKQAWNIVEFQEFNRMFDYLGWSDGTAYRRTFEEVKKEISEKWAKKNELEAQLQELDRERSELRIRATNPRTDPDDKVIIEARIEEIGREKLEIQKQAIAITQEISKLKEGISKIAMEKELEAALNNPDKSPPRDFRHMGEGGNALMEDTLKSMIDKLPQ